MHARGKFIETDIKKITLWEIIENNKIDFIDFLKLDKDEYVENCFGLQNLLNYR